jgi:hypothetical protein
MIEAEDLAQERAASDGKQQGKVRRKSGSYFTRPTFSIGQYPNTALP